MKKYVFMLALLCSTTTMNAQITSAYFGLRGKVKQATLVTYSFVEKFGEIEIGSKYRTQSVAFNKQGFLIEKVLKNDDSNNGYVDENSKPLSSHSFEYLFFEDGRLKEINEFTNDDFSDDKVLLFKTKFKYDESGQFIDKRLYSGSDGSLLATSTNLKEPIITTGADYKELGMSEANFFPSFVRDFELDEDDKRAAEGQQRKLTNKIDNIDQAGNWVKLRKFLEAKQLYGIERKIIYFAE